MVLELDLRIWEWEIMRSWIRYNENGPFILTYCQNRILSLCLVWNKSKTSNELLVRTSTWPLTNNINNNNKHTQILNNCRSSIVRNQDIIKLYETKWKLHEYFKLFTSLFEASITSVRKKIHSIVWTVSIQ